MGEDICSWELFLKVLGRVIGVGRKCRYIDECGNPRIRACRSDDGAAIRVPNQECGTADPLQGRRAEAHLGYACSAYRRSVQSEGRRHSLEIETELVHRCYQ